MWLGHGGEGREQKKEVGQGSEQRGGFGILPEVRKEAGGIDVKRMSEYQFYSRKLKQKQFQSYIPDLRRLLSKFNLPEISDYLLKIQSSLRWATPTQNWSGRKESRRINTKTGKGHQKWGCACQI